MLTEDQMSAPEVRFSIATNDLEKSIGLYRDVFGLAMRPFSNAIAMFPIGQVDFEVCLRSETADLIDYEFEALDAQGVMISLKFETENKLDEVINQSLGLGCTLIQRSSHYGTRYFRDFNGVIWSMNVQRGAASS